MQPNRSYEPYYQDGSVTIYHGDALEILPTLQDAELVLTDPPYNVGIVYGPTVDDLKGDYEAWCARWFAECRRISSTILLTPGIANLDMWFRIAKPDWVLAWHKPAAMGRAALGFNNWEPVLEWGRPVRQATDVIVAGIIPDPSVEGHPCPKPLRWATSLISQFCAPARLVVDPFMGSGTVLRAAKDMGRRAIGIEVEERYCDIAVRRLTQSVLALEDAG